MRKSDISESEYYFPFVEIIPSVLRRIGPRIILLPNSICCDDDGDPVG